MSIPKVINYCWIGNNEKPESVLRCIESWKEHCPDYEIVEWNDEKLYSVIESNPYTKQAYEAKAWGFVPDYLRLWIIYTYGGIYLDTDVQVIKSFDDLLLNKAFVGFEDNIYVNLGSGFGAEKGCLFLKEHMQQYESLTFINKDGSLNRIPSPQYTTELLKTYGLKENNGSIQNIKEVLVYPPEYFCPKSFTTGITKITKRTFSIHQFDASWYSEEEQKQRKEWEKAARKDYWIHAPNRLVRKVFGNDTIDKLKILLGK